MSSGKHNTHTTAQLKLTERQVAAYDRILERFWAKVERSGDGCWLWQASLIGGGYGQFTYRVLGDQVHAYAHRFSWELENGSIPEGLFVCHHCDVRTCVRPSHLFLGTQADNLNDARAKHRLIDGHGARQLSDDTYLDILTSSRARGTGKALARKYGISKVTVSRIRNGRQGTVFHRSQELAKARVPNPVTQVFQRVPHVLIPVRGEVG